VCIAKIAVAKSIVVSLCVNTSSRKLRTPVAVVTKVAHALRVVLGIGVFAFSHLLLFPRFALLDFHWNANYRILLLFLETVHLKLITRLCLLDFSAAKISLLRVL
jgi:hypothetical protein